MRSVLKLSRIELKTNNAIGCFVDFSFLASYLGKYFIQIDCMPIVSTTFFCKRKMLLLLGWLLPIVVFSQTKPKADSLKSVVMHEVTVVEKYCRFVRC